MSLIKEFRRIHVAQIVLINAENQGECQEIWLGRAELGLLGDVR